MATPETSSSELLKVIYAILGRRSARVVAWIALSVTGIWGIRVAISQIQPIIDTIRAIDVSGIELWNALLVIGILVMMVVMVVFAIKGSVALASAVLHGRLFEDERVDIDNTIVFLNDVLSDDTLSDDVRTRMKSHMEHIQRPRGLV
ncbi:MAG: hypothetical protein OXC95_04090 [Dehalococcoidia bacterium]|nr:hypothetical protein [Dehalococcoidia bacterium]